MRKRLSVILVMLVVLALVAVSAVAVTVTYAAGGATTTPTGTPLTQALLGTWLEKEDPYNPNSGKIYKMPSGIYYLAEDICLTYGVGDDAKAWPLYIESSVNVMLDLNGHVLDLRGEEYLDFWKPGADGQQPERRTQIPRGGQRPVGAG